MQYDLDPATGGWTTTGSRISPVSTGRGDCLRRDGLPRIIDFKAFEDIARSVGAVHMCDMAHIAGLVAAAPTPAPCPMPNSLHHHPQSLRGPRGSMILCKAAHAANVDKSVFPGMQAVLTCIPSAALPLRWRGIHRRIRPVRHQIVKNAKRLAAKLLEYGFTLVSGGTENHLILIDCATRACSARSSRRPRPCRNRYKLQHDSK